MGVVSDLFDIATLQATARTTYPEAHAAIAAAHRSRRLSSDAFAQGVQILRQLDASVNVLEIDQALAHRAGALAERHRLRGFDAVHLAAGLSLKLDDRPVIFATWDRRLHQAAFDTGLTPAPASI